VNFFEHRVMHTNDTSVERHHTDVDTGLLCVAAADNSKNVTANKTNAVLDCVPFTHQMLACVTTTTGNALCYVQGCGSGSAKILPLPHRLFDLKSNLTKKFCPFPNMD